MSEIKINKKKIKKPTNATSLSQICLAVWSGYIGSKDKLNELPPKASRSASEEASPSRDRTGSITSLVGCGTEDGTGGGTGSAASSVGGGTGQTLRLRRMGEVIRQMVTPIF